MALLPEYNEHLTRDVGALSPALTVVLVALGVDAIPHTTFHASHLEGFPAADATDQTIGTVLQVALVTAWHDRWLCPALRRLKTGHYRTTNCRDRHQPERGAAAITGRAFVPNPR